MAFAALNVVLGHDVSLGRTRRIRKWLWELWRDWPFGQRPEAQENKLGKMMIFFVFFAQWSENTLCFRANTCNYKLWCDVCFVCWLLQVQAASVLFVDNPVGTGFSYTDRPDRYATDVATVASDMLVLLQRFFKERPEFQVWHLLIEHVGCLNGCCGNCRSCWWKMK